MKTITAQELKEKLDNKEDLVLIHVLGKTQFDEKHIPGSINIPVSEIKERAEKELPDKDKMIIVYCASTECQASPSAARYLEEMGYTNVYDFESGLAGWDDEGFDFA